MVVMRSIIVAIAFMSVSFTANAVIYEVTITGTWDANDSTPLPSSAHFTEFVGTTHRKGNAFWKVGGLATEGVEDVAENGDTMSILEELSASAQNGISGPILNFDDLFDFPNSITRQFEIFSDRSFLTLISMIAPSPDWFVGVSGLNLREDNRWIENLTIDLRPYDAGTEEGDEFSPGNPATSPIEPISTLSGSPFNGRPSLGTLRFRLLTKQPIISDSAGSVLPGVISTLLD